MGNFEAQVQDIVRGAAPGTVRIAGGGSKQTRHGAIIDTTVHSGVIDYQPGEFIIQARAGTPLGEVAALLAERGQYLPFDPLLIESGATLGGAVAANASGPERFRYGGVRDFIIGCHFVDGNGTRLSGGGKVVKNAAGFDYPKLFVGSNGGLGVLLDVCFKVFPRPEEYQSLLLTFPAIDAATAALLKLAGAPLDIHALEIERVGPGYRLEVRVGGLSAGLGARMERVRALAGGGEIVTGADEAAHWRRAREMLWRGGSSVEVAVAKIPITPRQMAALEAQLPAAWPRRYGAGGNVAWVAVSETNIEALHTTCVAESLTGAIFLSGGKNTRGARLGKWPANPFAERVRRALDPQGKFALADSK